jgi:uncharacterized protein YjbJ (UPF0337 family)/vacuolar-type H+-ATPase subunit H
VTQNVYSGSTADDRRDADDAPDSNEIRADIDQTRQSVGDKIDQLQARLDPNKLKQQAADTVQEMLTDTANSMTDYVRSHREDITTSLADAARRNPLPAALVGVGIGWLILESFSGGKSSSQGPRYNDRYEDRWEDDRRNYARRSGGYRGTTQRYTQSDEYAAEDYSTFREPNYSSGTNFQSGYDYGQSGQSQQRSSGSGSNPIAKAAETVKGSVGDMGSDLKERVGDVSQSIKERVGDVKERVTDAVQGVRNQAEEMGSQTQQTMQHSMQRAGGTMQRAGNQMSEFQNRARYQGQRRGQQMMRNLEDNPLTYGIVALAAGAALAILLPQTRTENRAFGEMRDQVMERGQEALETAKTHAQQVVNEVRPELEETARKLVSDVKDAGKEVVQTAQSEIRPVVEKAVSKSKEEARNAAQEVGIDPNKLTGEKSNSPVVNKDTLKGSWHQMKGEVKRKWGQITDDELTTIEGDYDKLVGVLQSRYGYARGRAEQEVNDYLSSQKA